MLNFLNNIGPTELAVIVIILIIFFGSRLVTNLARTSGETVKEVKKLKKEFSSMVAGEEQK